MGASEKVCPVCGVSYADFRTGLTFGEVQAEMFVGSDDPAEWVYKRRHSVLGRWRMIKLAMWETHLNECQTVCATEERIEVWDY